MTAADIIRESFLFSDGETPPVDAQFEVRLSEGENVILSYWIGSAANMFENCWKAIDSGVHDDDQDFIAYVERYCPRGAAAIAVECVNRISAGGGFSVLSCGELCVLAVFAQIRAHARPPEDEIVAMLARIFARIREQMTEDMVARASL